MANEEWLAQCAISGLPLHAPPGFEPLLQSLRYQAQRLGLTMEPPSASRPAAEPASSLAFEFAAPGAAPVRVQIHAWADRRAAPASEFLVQAVSGLMAVHGRASGGSRALGVDLVSVATAALALQGAMASALAQRRGASASRVQLSMAGVALLCIGQYVAGATAPEEPERIAPGSSSPGEQPPFTSADGVAFELETLSTDPWRRFWTSLGVDGADRRARLECVLATLCPRGCAAAGGHASTPRHPAL